MSTLRIPPGPPPVKNPFAIMRLYSETKRDLLGLVARWFHEYGDMVKLEIMGDRQYVMAHPDHLHEVLVTKADKFHKDRDYTDPHRGLARFLGNGLLTSDGEFWKRQRRLAAPAFHSKRIAAYADTMVGVTRKMLDRWTDNAELDFNDEMMRTTLEIVTKALFHTDVSEEASRIGNAVTVLQHMSSEGANLLALLLPYWLPTPQRLREARAVRDLDEIVYSLIAERREAGTPDLGDLLFMLMLAQDEDGSHMSDKQLRDETVTIFLAGHETTANTLNWTFYLLTQNPEVEAKLHHELDTVLQGQPPTLEDLKRLPYTEMVIKESMRLYPPAYGVGRLAIEDTTIGGYDVPKGTSIGIFTYFTHRDPRWWDNPEAFIPERFSPENEPNIRRYAYLPFGAGPRVCIGNSFAMMEAQIMLATIAQRYELRLAPGQRVEPEPLITLRPKGGLRMIARERQTVPTVFAT